MSDPSLGWIPTEIMLPGNGMDGEDFLVLTYCHDAYDIWSEDASWPAILIGENDVIFEATNIWHAGQWHTDRRYDPSEVREDAFCRTLWWRPIIWPALPREEEIQRMVERARKPGMVIFGEAIETSPGAEMGWTRFEKSRPGSNNEEFLVLAYSRGRYEDKSTITRPLLKLSEDEVLEGKLAIWIDGEWHTDMPSTEENRIENVLWWRPIIWAALPVEELLYEKAEQLEANAKAALKAKEQERASIVKVHKE